VWKTYAGYNDYVEVIEKTLTDIPGMFLIADVPFKFENKNENEAISISKLQSFKTMIEYNSGVDFVATSSVISEVFPPFDLSSKHPSVKRNIVSTNATINNKKQNIIGPV
jgi:hypothetical protein